LAAPAGTGRTPLVRLGRHDRTIPDRSQGLRDDRTGRRAGSSDVVHPHRATSPAA
jgi:hypothetical protein